MMSRAFELGMSLLVAAGGFGLAILISPYLPL
jgi:hypothetical protein